MAVTPLASGANGATRTTRVGGLKLHGPTDCTSPTAYEHFCDATENVAHNLSSSLLDCAKKKKGNKNSRNPTVLSMFSPM